MKPIVAFTTLAAQSLHEEHRALALATVFMRYKTPNMVAFAFDDGPWIYNSDEIVAFLANQSVKATFFFNGDNCCSQANPTKACHIRTDPSTPSNTTHSCARIFDVQDPQEFSTNQQGSTPFHNLTQLNIEHRLIGKGISFDFPIAGDDGEDNDTGIVMIRSNYHYDVPFE
ncbi:chitin deacetylase [Moniliophthora roreri MCA 2997]|uniref:Chitin deacetylase n=1 Tax=Moniliophthora roreri (strain MCA 2997) TaxID=1381753 RepID=V2WY93_MONRO|nr:chitin deacetylase [Moniliophthora roreri MCA 2997]